MRTLNNGTGAGSATPNSQRTRSRAGATPALRAAVLALFLCVLATPELHAATIVPRDAVVRGAPATLTSRRVVRSLAKASASAQRKTDCGAYFNAMFGAMDQLDQAWASYDATGGSPLLDMAAEGYLIWAADGVASAQAQLTACLSG